MPDIRFVSMSDMHLGDNSSLLTNLKTASFDTSPFQPSPVMRQMVECLKSLISKNEGEIKPVLILNGDIFELALAPPNEASMVFERFIELTMQEGQELFSGIIFIPGNHDHHLWELARETQYVDHLQSIEWGKYLDSPWHTTRLFIKKDIPSYFLTKLVRRFPNLAENGFTVNTAYPNFGLFREDTRKCAIFHHGHFTEPIYSFVTWLTELIFPDRAKPLTVGEIESENFAWIDFMWSTIGQAGKAGKDIKLIYQKMQDREAFQKLLSNLAETLARRYDLPGWGDIMEAGLLKVFFEGLMDKIPGLERSKTEKILTPELEKGLWEYVNTPLKNQIMEELGGSMPYDVTFVFGHTHKPFQEDLNFREYPQWVNVYNTGGWVVDTVDPEPLHGAAMVLLDEDLNAVSVRMYNESADPRAYSVSVEEATHAGEVRNPLYLKIRQLVDPLEDPWKSFSEMAGRAVRVREQNLRAAINERRLT